MIGSRGAHQSHISGGRESASDGIRFSSVKYRHRRPLNIQRDQLVFLQINWGLICPFSQVMLELSRDFDRHFSEEALIDVLKILVLNVVI